MNNFDSVYSLGVVDRVNAMESNTYRTMDKGPNCIDNVIPNSIPEYSALKDAIKDKGKPVVCAQVRRTLAGNRKYFIALNSTKDQEQGFIIYLFSLANGLYNRMGPFPTLDSALSRADCYGLFQEGVKDMTEETLTKMKEAVGDYVGDDENGDPIYDEYFDELEDFNDDFCSDCIDEEELGNFEYDDMLDDDELSDYSMETERPEPDDQEVENYSFEDDDYFDLFDDI